MNNTSPSAAEPDKALIGALGSPRAAVLANAANELVFAVVGHVGSGTSTVAQSLRTLLTSPDLGFDVEILSARDVIVSWAVGNGKAVPGTATPKLQGVQMLQDCGDAMRAQTDDYSSVARALIAAIRTTRARKTGVSNPGDSAVAPDGKPRAYLLDSIRHPAEVELLRHVYQDAFVLIGIVCEEEVRARRLSQRKYQEAGIENVRRFMARDAKAPPPNGQRVAEAFHMADFFVDNTVDRLSSDGTSNEAWNINDKLGRLLRILTHRAIIRPETAETAMSYAATAAMRSACLSRQVGAALTDANGNVVATGSNEVPKAGGGVYGESYNPDDPDHRCAFRKLSPGLRPYCSNTTEQNRIVDQLIEEVPELSALAPIRKPLKRS
jgi:deoxycytidylate deaminase